MESQGGASGVPLTQLLGFALLYWSAAWLGKCLTIAPDVGAALWPPSGLFVAVLLLHSRRTWPSWVAAALATDIVASRTLFDFDLSLALPIAAANGLEALFSVWLLRRFVHARAVFHDVRSMLAFLGCCVGIAPMVSAILGAAALHKTVAPSYWRAWSLWWTGDATGVILLAPLVLAFSRRPTRVRSVKKTASEFCLLLLVAIGSEHLSFGGGFPFTYVVFPSLIWAALRFGTVGVGAVMLVLTTLISLHTMQDRGPFAADSLGPAGRQLALQVFLLVAGSVSLLLATLTRGIREMQREVTRATETAERRGAELEDAMSRAKTLIEHTSDAVAIVNRHGTVLDCNAAYQLIAADSDMRTRLSGGLSSTDAGTGSSEEQYLEWKSLTLRMRVVPLLDPGDHLVVSLSDETELVRLRDAVSMATRTRHEFVARLAHEMRNPLAPLGSGIAILQRESLPREVLQQTLAMLRRQLAQMAGMIEDLLDVSRTATGKIQLVRKPATVQEIIALAVETARPHLDRHMHVFECRVPNQPIWVRADKARLAQAITNLLINAAKYTPAKGSIVLSAHESGARARIEICDNGVGISADMLPGIFELYTQIETSKLRAEGGLGIGLALVKSIVELHDGTVSAESQGLGRGSKFTLTVPITLPKHAMSVSE